MVWKRKRREVVCDEENCRTVIKTNATMKEGQGVQFCTRCSNKRRKLYKLLNDPYKFAKPSNLSFFGIWVKLTVGDEIVEGVLANEQGTPLHCIAIGKPIYLAQDAGVRPFFRSAIVESVESARDGWNFKAGGRDWIAEIPRVYH
jgi:hypothetical protein